MAAVKKEVAIDKKDLLGWILIFLIIPIIFTIGYFVAWRYEDGSKIVLGIIIIFWILAIILIALSIKEANTNPYPFHYLLGYDTLLDYMKRTDKDSFDNNFEASFHFYLYNEKEKSDIQAWHFSSSNLKTEQVKGDIYYFNNEEFKSIDELIAERIPRFEGYVLVELLSGDDITLNKFREDHKELDVVSYVENLPKSLK